VAGLAPVITRKSKFRDFCSKTGFRPQLRHKAEEIIKALRNPFAANALDRQLQEGSVHMNHPQTLTRHRDIQNWVTARRGMPAIARVSSITGEVRARLALRFGKTRRPSALPDVDDGMSPVSWSSWLAELDRQQLALKVSEAGDDFEFVERREVTSRAPSGEQLN
jgi:hypothetical protein